MGRNWAIAVGINNYENLQPLKYARGDAEAMVDWFNEVKFDKVFAFTDNSPPIDEVNPPISTTPTYGHLRRFFRAQFENIKKPLLKPEDNLWFFFAGHGKRHGDKDYLMLSDTDPGDVEHTAISVDYVTGRLRRSGAENVVLLLDACRDESNRSRGELGIGKEHQGTITFYSCNANQQSWEIEELEHGIFTHTLLQGLRMQGEGNCATVERLDQYLRYYVPRLNSSYRKPVQNPYLKAEPPYKMYFILLEQSATLKDVEPLKFQASLAENEGNLALAEQLWIRVLAVSRADLDAIAAIKRIARRQTQTSAYSTQEPVIPASEAATSSRGGEKKLSGVDTQTEAQHQQNLVEYQQRFSQAVEQKFPLSKASRRQLKSLQQYLQLTDKEVSQIEKPINDRKQAEYLQRQEEEKIRQQREAQRLRQQQEAQKQRKREAQRRKQQQQLEQWRQLFANITTPINRRQFLKWAGFGGGSLVTVLVGREIFIINQSPLTPESTISPTPQTTNKATTTSISVAKPKYEPTKGGRKPFGLPLWTVKFETVTVDARGEVIERHPNKQANFFKEELGNGVTLEMVEIPGGSFKMGSPLEEKGRSKDEGPQRNVEVSAFFMGKYQVTQAQYQAIMGKNPSYFKGDKHPVDSVSWNDAVEFCKKLSQKTGHTYRLPSEAEWEYACRSGTNTPFHFGETITDKLANYDASRTFANEPKGKYRQKTTPVGEFPPNGFSLYDMHGNVWEWCADYWHENYEGAPTDHKPWVVSGDKSYRVLRGGSWLNIPEVCRSALRSWYVPVSDYDGIGLRVVCVVAPRTLYS